jgi:hypothetical protein
MLHTLAAVLAVTLSGAGTAPARSAEPAPNDYMYTFRTTGDDSGDPTSGTVRVHGDRIRIDLDKNKSNDGSYILITGDRMMSVNPERREVHQMSAPTFEHIIGVSLRAVSPMVRFNVSNATISTERLGAGEQMLGHATEHVRMTEKFDVHIVALGFDGGTERYSIVSDYWVSPGLYLGSNPLLALLEHASSAMAQTDADFVQKEKTARTEVLTGTPLRTVVTESNIDEKGIRHSKTRSIDITSLNIRPQDAGLFQVPSGYRIKSGIKFSG